MRRFFIYTLCGLFGSLQAGLAEAAIETSAKYAYMVDAETGTVLLDKDSSVAMNPSSMSKLMTMYVLFEALKNQNITLDTTFHVSEKAWKMGGSKMFVKVGDDVRVEDLIRGIIVQSGNDACVVVAEGIAGTEEVFAERMNSAAEKLGLKQSHFVNSTGWPDPDHVMSARDIAVLAQAIIQEFPEYYPYYSETEFTYANIKQRNRNRLIGNTLGVDGLKTGHTEVAGYGISLSAKDVDTGRRVVLVVNGLDSDSSRISEGAKLLSYGLKAFENKSIARKGHVISSLPVWFGSKNNVTVAAGQDVMATVSKGDNGSFSAKIQALTPLKAPIQKGDKVGTLVLTLGDNQQEIPLVATQAVAKANGLRWIKQFFYQHLLSGRE